MSTKRKTKGLTAHQLSQAKEMRRIRACVGVMRAEYSFDAIVDRINNSPPTDIFALNMLQQQRSFNQHPKVARTDFSVGLRNRI